MAGTAREEVAQWRVAGVEVLGSICSWEGIFLALELDMGISADMTRFVKAANAVAKLDLGKERLGLNWRTWNVSQRRVA